MGARDVMTCHRPQDSCTGPGCTDAKALARALSASQTECDALRADLRAVALAAIAFHATVCRSCPDALDTPLFRTEEGALASALARPGVTTLLEETR